MFSYASSLVSIYSLLITNDIIVSEHSLVKWKIKFFQKNKSYLRYNKTFYGLQAGIFLIGPVLSLLFSAYPTIVISIATVMTLGIEASFYEFYMTRTKKFSTPNWDLY